MKLSVSPRPALSLSLCVSVLFPANAALAQEEMEASDSASQSSGVDLEEEEGDEAVDLGTGSEAAPSVPVDESIEGDGEPISEDTNSAPDGSTQLLIGLRYRGMVAPKFLINMFGVDGGRSVWLNGFGGEVGGYFGNGGNGFTLMGGVWHMGYGLEETPFKGRNDDNSAWEIVESQLGVTYITVDTMLDRRIVDKLSFQVGGSFGLGIVSGDLFRNEAYVDNVNPDLPAEKDWPNLSKCAGPASPNPVECPGDGEYGKADFWPVYPWVNFQMGLRYQPIDEFVGRLDIGLGSSGIWFGLGADYSIWL